MPESEMEFLKSYSEAFGKEFEGKREKAIGLPPQTVEFLDVVVKDFTYYTALMLFLRDARQKLSLSQIASETGEPKKVVRPVLDLFIKEGLVRETGGFFSKYVLDAAGSKWFLTLDTFERLMRHKDARLVIMRKIVMKTQKGGQTDK